MTVDVLIVGGGPVGLTARALLERWGVRALLVEKRVELSPFPRSRLVNVRSMEIFRQLGLADTIAAGAFAAEYGRIRFRDTLLGHDFASAAMIGVNAPVPESPAIGVVTSQDRLEPTLLEAADEADAQVRFGAEVVGLVEEGDGVTVRLVDRRSGEETRVRARYVLAADGANSTVRELLGIPTAGPGALGHVTTVVFDADLTGWSAGQPAGVYATAHGSFLPLYPEGGWAWVAPTPDDPERADWSGLVSHALGPDGHGVQADVLRVQHWTTTAYVAERFRHRRILLAGDAAHTLPPAGGLGMNVGIADAHNLCWKLAGVLRGWAGAGLLDSYETERRPVAQLNLRQAVANAKLMFQAQDRRREQLRNGAGADVPDQVELPWSERYFAQLGLALGISYRSGAVLVDDSTPPQGSAQAPPQASRQAAFDAPPQASPHASPQAPSHAPPQLSDPDPDPDYTPTAEPGHRMPHLWLTPGRSTLDSFGEWFTLLTPDPGSWEQQADPSSLAPLRVEELPGEYAEHCGLRPAGALLVRPDGHIGARWTDRPDGDSAVRSALAGISRPAPLSS
ncbi:FAD-dependent monooxygenase [Streptomyces sp. NPDC002680]|uniref:FAD-dependent monooxygenase n=1 Tax=Streptomyces sp. NPDC002680 TaxID=3364659 RepID=UPI0036C6755A